MKTSTTFIILFVAFACIAFGQTVACSRDVMRNFARMRLQSILSRYPELADEIRNGQLNNQYGNQGGYPNQQGNYPNNQQGGYPNQQGGYQGNQQGYNQRNNQPLNNRPNQPLNNQTPLNGQQGQGLNQGQNQGLNQRTLPNQNGNQVVPDTNNPVSPVQV